MTENAGLRAVVSKAEIIDELENTLPGWLKRQGGNRWYPYYIHMLKVIFFALNILDKILSSRVI